MNKFEDLKIWQKSMKLAELVYDATRHFPSEEKFNLTSQMRRCSVSIPSNIAEGAGKYSKNDKKNFYIISRGSVNEYVALLRILKLEKIIDEQQHQVLYDKLLSIGKILSGLINSMLRR